MKTNKIHSFKNTHICIIAQQFEIILGQELIVKRPFLEHKTVSFNFPKSHLVHDCGRNLAFASIFAHVRMAVDV